MGLGAVLVTIAVLAVAGWLVFLMGHTRLQRRKPTPAPNQSQFMDDAELEGPRLTTILLSALVAAAVLAIVLPIYYLSESGRQADAAEHFDEIAVERGEHWYEEFQCGDCHGPGGVGGGATYVESRTGLQTTWLAPSLNDIFYRYGEDEVRYWLVYGRQGTPMPAWGVEGGGPLNSQQIDELLAYLDHIEIDQTAAVAEVENQVGRELTRLEGADAAVEQAIADQEAEISALAAAPAQYAAVRDLPDALDSLLREPGTCTGASAGLLSLPCEAPAADSDRDGLSDDTERGIADLVSRMIAGAPDSDARTALERIQSQGSFDPVAQYAISGSGAPVDDLDTAEAVITEFETILRDLALASDNLDRLLAAAEDSLAALVEAGTARRWAVDFEAIAAAEFGGNLAEARRGAALYNGYCARCHTAGYSAGVVFTQEAGSGALGPSLRDGRSIVQFPEAADQLEFIKVGSDNGKAFGVNGIGRGWMPGFGAVLTEADLDLIVRFERALP